MTGMRELNAQEKQGLAYALALARNDNYRRASELHQKAFDMEESGSVESRAFYDEAEEYEIMADINDRLIDFVVSGRIRIVYSDGEDER